ncbi:MAG TPA: hypothetical protein VIV37_08280 [Gaiellaceae bacterium]
MQVVQARATFVTPETFDESLTTIVARSVLEAALQDEDSAELWFELGDDSSGEDVSRLSIDLSHTDIEELLRLTPDDEIALTLDGAAVESMFDPDVEAHGLKGAIAIAVTSAAILAPAAQAGVAPQSVDAAATQQATIQATTQIGAAATTQISAASRVQAVSAQSKLQVAKTQVAKVSGLKLLRSGLLAR